MCSLSVHRLDGGLPQTGPADSAGAQEHRHPAPDQLHQGDNRGGQRVRRESGGAGSRMAQQDSAGRCALVSIYDIYLLFRGYKIRGQL